MGVWGGGVRIGLVEKVTLKKRRELLMQVCLVRHMEEHPSRESPVHRPQGTMPGLWEEVWGELVWLEQSEGGVRVSRAP